LERVDEKAWRAWDDETWLIHGRGFRPFYVVDGQQRLTTAIVLVKCLLDRVPNDGQLAFTDELDRVKKYLVQTSGISRAYIFGYQKDNPSYEYLKTQILEQPSNQYQGTETTYTANLLAALKFFKKKIEPADPENLERWFKNLTQKLLFNVYELIEDLDVFVVFETMNNRGKPLSKLELLKNRIIYLSTLLNEDIQQRSLRQNTNDTWKTVFEFLGREKGSPLDDDDFLRAHWIMYFTYAREQASQFSSFLLNTHFTPQRTRAGSLNAADLQTYVSSIQDSVRKWHDVYFPERATSLSEGTRRELEKLDRLGRGAFEPLIMAALQIGVEDGAGVIELLRAAERFIFLISGVCRRRADTGDSEFYRLAHQVFSRETALAQAVEAINARTERHFSVEKAITDMRELFRYEQGFYSWGGLRYFLFEYEQNLRDRAGMASPKLNWNEFVGSRRDQETVEHIYPYTPELSDWPEFEARDQRERPVLRNSLGNLLALSQSRNSRFSNRPFERKKQDADGVKGYYNGSYSEIAVAQTLSWTPNAVLKRGLEMLEFLERRWLISLGSNEEKIQFLNLEFVDPGVS